MVGEGEEMKKREIGQCKDCRNYLNKKYVFNFTWEAPWDGQCNKQKKRSSDTAAVDKTFGCWYWKEKR
jgi:hypothetical protein